jgi:GT2 family glycosyltransferase
MYAGLRRALIARLPRPAVSALKRARDLPAWFAQARRSGAAAQLEAARHEAEGLGTRPLISLVMPAYKTDQRYLREAVDSVIAQVYPEWELVVVDDGSEDEVLKRTLEAYAAAEPRVRFEPLAANAGIAAASNTGLALCRGEYVAFLDHDDVLTPDALLRVVQALAADPELDVVYSDSDKLNGRGVRADPFLKPDWSPVYALGAMYIGHLLVLRRSLAEEAGGFDPAFDKIQDFEFMLRVSERTDRIGHIPQILYHWRAIPGSIAAGAEEKSGVPELQARAVSAHLERRGVDLVAEAHPTIPHRAVLAKRNGSPGARVSVVIAAREGGAPLRRLLGSMLDGPARPPAETIVVAGPGADPGRGDVTVIEAPPEPFNRAAHNNTGARAASGSHLVFLAEECEIVDPDWLGRLLLPIAIPGVGAAGPLLLRPDGRVEQAGLAIGLDGVASPMSAGADGEGDGYYGSLPCAHEVSALSAECMLVGREDFEAVGGFNELYSIQFEDFDLCRRLAGRGLASVYAARPRVLSHRTPAVRRAQTDIVDRALFVDCWYDELLRGDPYFNPAFSHERADYSPAGWRERVNRAAAPVGRR